jgi:hypothetical protein
MDDSFMFSPHALGNGVMEYWGVGGKKGNGVLGHWGVGVKTKLNQTISFNLGLVWFGFTPLPRHPITPIPPSPNT